MSLGLPFEREFFAQGKVRIAFPHQDAAQIGMVVETQTHHVVDLALVPVGGRPDVGDGVDGRIFFARRAASAADELDMVIE